ncbi:MAG: M48 family metalloprotease [Myxococcales bacterium]|nr:M48 family metalloprotease [Myxococcales bacterium]
MRAAMAVLCLLAWTQGCVSLQENSGSRESEAGIEREMRLGAEIHQQIRSQGVLLNDPVILEYVNEIGQELVGATEPQPFIYRFNVIDDDSLNAFATYGGYIYLHAGVLAQAGRTSELAGVLAHEVAHVRRRHLMKASEKNKLPNLAANLAAVAAIAAGAGPEALILAQSFNVSMQLQHTREAEADADLQAVEYMGRAGYDPQGLIRFFERIQTESRNYDANIPPYLFSHPDIADRIRATRVTLERGPAPGAPRPEDERLPAIQGRLAGLRNTIAGGSGLKRRSDFDRSLTDPLFDRIDRALKQDRTEDARKELARAERLEPNDPRIYLTRADLAEADDDLLTAERNLEEAFRLDPSVPLVQYRLGLINKKLGNRTRAVFYLELAASSFRPGSSGARRAMLEIETLSFPLLEESWIGADGGEREASELDTFERGEAITWNALVARRFVLRHPSFEVRWIDPEGRVAEREIVLMQADRKALARFDTTHADLGAWRIVVRSGDSQVYARPFRIFTRP